MSQPAPDQAEVDAAAAASLATLVAAQAAARAALTRQAVALVRQSAGSFTGWYDSDQITDWATKLSTRIEALQRALAQQTDAFLARTLTQLTGARVRPVGRVDVASLRRDITHAGAYGRAADVFRWQQSQFDHFAEKVAQVDLTGPIGITPLKLVDPVDAAVDRVAAVADMDMQLADRAQSQKVLTEYAERREISGYRRVIHPEVSRGGSCGLCIAASDRVYSIEDLRPIHGRCECTTLPIVNGVDPGSGLNNLDLGTLYGHAGGTTSGRALKRTRYRVDDHGELGPVLTNGTFRTRKQADRDTNHARKPKSAARAREDVDRILSMEMSAQDLAHQLATDDPKQWGRYAEQLDARIADLRSQLAQVL
jgi:hypothetical protein